MPTQLELAKQVPIARQSDPETSHEAAALLTASGVRGRQHRMALQLVKDNPGSTSFELAIGGGLDRYQLARRLPELEKVRLVRKSLPRPCAITGRQAVTWCAVIPFLPGEGQGAADDS